MAEKLQIIIVGRDKFSKALGKLSKALPSLKTVALGASAAIVGVGAALIAMTKSTAEAFDAVQKFSDQLGLSTEFLSGMQHAAELSGVQIKTMNKSLQQLQVRVGEAGRGIGEGKDAFESLGIEIHSTTGMLKTAESILPELAEALHNTASATERAEIASKIFGQRGIQMLQIFKNGKAGLEAMTAEAEKFGLIIDSQAGQQAAEFNDSLTRLKASLIGLRNEIAKNIMPIITGLANRFAEFIANNRKSILFWSTDFIKSLGLVLEYTGYVVAAMIDSWRGLEMTFHLLLSAAANFAADFLRIFETISGGTDRFIKVFSELAPLLGVTGIALERLTESWRQSNVTTQEAIENLKEFSGEQFQSMLDIVDTGSAVSRLSEFTEKFRQMLAEIQAEGLPKVDMEIGIKEQLSEGIEESKVKTAEWFEWLHNARIDEMEGWKELVEEVIAESSGTAESLTTSAFEGMSAMAGQTLALTQRFGKKAFGAQKAIGIADATIKAYQAFNTNLAAYPYPIGPIMAAIALATGLAQVAMIASLEPQGQAHAGLTNVPREGSYLLSQNERVLSPIQNQDLTEFLSSDKTPSVENMVVNIEILPNATNANALLEMDERVFEEIVEAQIIPALSKLKSSGITYD